MSMVNGMRKENGLWSLRRVKYWEMTQMHAIVMVFDGNGKKKCAITLIFSFD